MNSINKFLFENLDNTHYTNAEAAAKEYEIFNHEFKDILGYNEHTGGSVVLQKGHQPAGLPDELPITLLLKEAGHFVILLDETGKGKQIDALIDGSTFELKNLRNATNVFQRIKKDCQSALSKGTENVVININVALDKEELIVILRRLAKSPQVKGLKIFWCIMDSKLLKFDMSNFQ